MSSLYLNSLSIDQRNELEKRLHDSQTGKCFICEKSIDLKLHNGSLDVDHVEPLKVGGKDDPINFALTHASCNRSKQATDLRVARVLSRFSNIRDEISKENRGPNLGDILTRYNGSKYEISIILENECVKISMPEIGKNQILTLPLYIDEISGVNYFFIKIPLSYVFHDNHINPRAVGGSLSKLVEEFHKKRPQLHVALGWIKLNQGENKGQISIFDGQHKVCAQILLGAKELPVRVFVNPNTDILLTANTNAGTTLRQVAFDKSVQRHLGSALFQDRIDRFKNDRGHPSDFENFSEKDLVNHFKGEWREMKRYILDATRDEVSHHPENKLRDYIEFGGKGKERPISYSTVEKTFYSFFIFGEVLETPFNARLEEGENPRELEKEQLVRLMNLIADSIFSGSFDPSVGISRLENRVHKGEEDIPEAHLRAHRMAREEILYNWLGFIRQIVLNYFITTGKPVKEDRLFQYRFPEPLWDNIENFLENLKKLPLWANRDLASSVFGGKQNYAFWETVFETGKTPQGQQVLPSGGINLMKMISSL